MPLARLKTRLRALKAATQLLWFYATTRRECCACGVWLGRSNPFGWRKTTGYCVDCGLAAHRQATDYLRGMIAQSLDDHGHDAAGSHLFTFGPAGPSKNTLLGSQVGFELGSFEKENSLIPVADPMSARPNPFRQEPARSALSSVNSVSVPDPSDTPANAVGAIQPRNLPHIASHNKALRAD